MNVALFAEVLLNWLADVLGPLTTFHVPVPTDGALADKVVLPAVRHTLWSGPALAVGAGFTVTVTQLLVSLHETASTVLVTTTR